MSFNLDVSKRAQEVIFSRKKNIGNHLAVFFDNLPINRKSTQKHLDLLLDEKLNFSEHINEKLKKVCVCVCVCVFILFHREGFFRLQDIYVL